MQDTSKNPDCTSGFLCDMRLYAVVRVAIIDYAPLEATWAFA